MKSRKCNTSQQ